MTNLPPNSHYVFYASFGVHLTEGSRKFAATCPFCGRADKFEVDKDDGLFGCHVCGRIGNHYSFINFLHEDSLKNTSDAHYQDLADNRGYIPETLKVAKIAKSVLNDSWLIPSWNAENKLANLYQAIPTEKGSNNGQGKIEYRLHSGNNPISGTGNVPRTNLSNRTSRIPPERPNENHHHHRAGLDSHRKNVRTKYEIRSAPYPCQQQLYGIELVKKQPLLIICEGHWDRLALWEVLAHLHTPGEIFRSSSIEIAAIGQPDYFSGLMEQVAIVGVPGANIFKPDWTSYLRNRHVVLIYDNDADKVICPICRGKEGYNAHLKGTPCPMCQGSTTTGFVINPGRDGMRKVHKELSELGVSPLSLHYVAWRQGDPKDVRDLLNL